MSLNTVFLVFMEMDSFRNVGIREKGYIFILQFSLFSIFKYRIRLLSDNPHHILYCDSKPCTLSNVVDNCYVWCILSFLTRLRNHLVIINLVILIQNIVNLYLVSFLLPLILRKCLYAIWFVGE